MDIDIRRPTEDEMGAWVAAESAGFGFHPSDEQVEADLSVQPDERVLGAFDRGRVVGTTASFPFAMTVPGGASPPVAGVTAVTVTSTHRRRGILTEMMRVQLDDVSARGDVAAVLNASESGIYPRFGYGLASLHQTVRVDTGRSAFGAVPEVSGELVLVPKAEAAPLVAAAWERCRPHTPGEVSRSDGWWAVILGDTVVWKGGGKWFVLVHLDPAGEADGYALYQVAQDGMAGTWLLEVRELIAADPGVRAALWRQLLDTDLVGTVELFAAPVDEPLRWWLRDGRQAQVTRVHDYLWVRPLDVEALLSTRVYGGDESLVVEVHDPFRPQTDGCYRVTPAGAAPGACERTDDAPDLSMDVGELGGLSLGGVAPPTFLARAGRITERRPGALGAADRLFAWTAAAPFCATRF